MKYDFEQFFDLSIDMLCIASPEGYFLRVNPAFERTLGWTQEELTSRPFVEFVHPEDVEATLTEVEKLAAGEPTLSFTNRYRCADGSYRTLLWTAFPEPESGQLFAIARDTTTLLQANERFSMVFNSSPAAMILVDQDGRINLVNIKAEDLFGYSRVEMIGQTIEMLIPASLRRRHRDHRGSYDLKRESRPMGTGRHLVAVAKDGTQIPVEVGLNPIHLDGQDMVLSSVVDLTVQKELEESMLALTRELEKVNARLAELASTDTLTGLKNRRVFDDQIANHMKLMSRMSSSLSLLMIDIDHFKRYNDQHGHVAGDELLTKLAELLEENCRASDLVARYGGEEFVIILPDTTQEGAVRVAEAIRQAIERHAWTHDNVTISVGASTMSFQQGQTLGEDGPEMLILGADRALYHSKNSGRNRSTHIFEIMASDGDGESNGDGR